MSYINDNFSQVEKGERARERARETERVQAYQVNLTTDRYNPVDLHVYDPVSKSWNLLPPLPAPERGSYAGRPSFRDEFGFTSAGGKLYVHGGWSWFSGDKCKGECISEISGERDHSTKPIRVTNWTHSAFSLCLL
jgi:hypothetical protein